jgi:RNA polymerase sigma-70 factor (ECF subfamily)
MPPGPATLSSPAAPAPPCVVADDHARWFAEEVHAHEGQLKAYLRCSFSNVRDVDDVVQESYVRMWKRQMAKPIEQAKAFLFAVARNVALGTLRREKRSPIVAVTDFAASGIIEEGRDAAEALCSTEEVELLFAAIAHLSARTREIYLLKKFEGLAQKEIAEKLGISPHTVESHITRANKRCYAFLRERGVGVKDTDES